MTTIFEVKKEIPVHRPARVLPVQCPRLGTLYEERVL